MSTKEILEHVKQLSMRINVLADMQMLVMEELGDKNPRFQTKASKNIIAR